MNQELIKKKRRILRKTPPEKVLEEVRRGNKFIVLEDDINTVPEGYMLVDMKYKESSFKTLVPQQLMFFLANPGEGSIDDALDEVSNFYNEVEDFEDDEIANGKTNVQDVSWATTSKEAYQTYLINKLTKNGKDFDEDVLKELDLKDPYVEQRAKGIAALCLEKSPEELKKAELSDILKHVTINYNVKEKVKKKELHRVKCWSGSHYETRNEYKTVTKTETVTKHKDYVVLDKKISELEKGIEDYRIKKRKEIGRHDNNLIREYINLNYIAKENPEAQLDIKPAEKKEK